MVRQDTKKDIDRQQVVRYLTSTFARISSNLGPANHKGTPLYDAQVEFCYLMDDIQRGAPYIIPKAIQAANTFIDEMKERNK